MEPPNRIKESDWKELARENRKDLVALGFKAPGEGQLSLLRAGFAHSRLVSV